MLTVLRRSLLIRGFIYSEFVSDYYDEFLEEIGAWSRMARFAIANKSWRALKQRPVPLSDVRRQKFRQGHRQSSLIA